MKPTQEQVLAWAREVADISTDYRGREEFIFDSYGIERFAALAYEAGRKDENEACVEEAAYYAAHSLTAKNILDAIRARREQ